MPPRRPPFSLPLLLRRARRERECHAELPLAVTRRRAAAILCRFCCRYAAVIFADYRSPPPFRACLLLCRQRHAAEKMAAEIRARKDAMRAEDDEAPSAPRCTRYYCCLSMRATRLRRLFRYTRARMMPSYSLMLYGTPCAKILYATDDAARCCFDVIDSHDIIILMPWRRE